MENTPNTTQPTTMPECAKLLQQIIFCMSNSKKISEQYSTRQLIDTMIVRLYDVQQEITENFKQ